MRIVFIKIYPADFNIGCSIKLLNFGLHSDDAIVAHLLEQESWCVEQGAASLVIGI